MFQSVPLLLIYRNFQYEALQKNTGRIVPIKNPITNFLLLQSFWISLLANSFLTLESWLGKSHQLRFPPMIGAYFPALSPAEYFLSKSQPKNFQIYELRRGISFWDFKLKLVFWEPKKTQKANFTFFLLDPISIFSKPTGRISSRKLSVEHFLNSGRVHHE